MARGLSDLDEGSSGDERTLLDPMVALKLWTYALAAAAGSFSGGIFSMTFVVVEGCFVVVDDDNVELGAAAIAAVLGKDVEDVEDEVLAAAVELLAAGPT